MTVATYCHACGGCDNNRMHAASTIMPGFIAPYYNARFCLIDGGKLTLTSCSITGI